MKQHEASRARVAALEDAVSRCLRHFREVVVVELAPSSWGSEDLLLDPPLEGPRWEGMPGTHPMIDLLHEALNGDRLRRHKKEIEEQLG